MTFFLDAEFKPEPHSTSRRSEMWTVLLVGEYPPRVTHTYTVVLETWSVAYFLHLQTYVRTGWCKHNTPQIVSVTNAACMFYLIVVFGTIMTVTISGKG